MDSRSWLLELCSAFHAQYIHLLSSQFPMKLILQETCDSLTNFLTFIHINRPGSFTLLLASSRKNGLFFMGSWGVKVMITTKLRPLSDWSLGQESKLWGGSLFGAKHAFIRSIGSCINLLNHWDFASSMSKQFQTKICLGSGFEL